MDDKQNNPFRDYNYNVWHHIVSSKKSRPLNKTGYLVYGLTTKLECLFDSLKQYSLKRLDERGSTEPLIMKYENTQYHLAFESFISQINQYGNADTLIKESVPNYNRIKFYRNKIVEHWNEYNTISISRNGRMGKFDKIPLPFYMGNINCIAKKAEGLNKINLLFSEYENTTYIDYEDIFDEYHEKIFNNLSKIEPRLNFKKSQNKELIEAIFDYYIPIPIYDVEEFCSQMMTNINEINIIKNI